MFRNSAVPSARLFTYQGAIPNFRHILALPLSPALVSVRIGAVGL